MESHAHEDSTHRTAPSNRFHVDGFCRRMVWIDDWLLVLWTCRRDNQVSSQGCNEITINPQPMNTQKKTSALNKDGRVKICSPSNIDATITTLNQIDLWIVETCYEAWPVIVCKTLPVYCQPMIALSRSVTSSHQLFNLHRFHFPPIPHLFAHFR